MSRRNSGLLAYDASSCARIWTAVSGSCSYPQIHDLQLVFGLAAQQLPVVAHLQHFLQALRPISAGEEEQESQDLRGGRRHVGVVVIEADAKVRVGQRRIEVESALERILDFLALARRRKALASEHVPLNERRVRSGEIEPRFGAIRLALRPRFSRGDGRCGQGIEPRVERAALRVQLDFPPRGHGAHRRAGLGRRRRAGVRQLRVNGVEARVKDRVVHRGELGPAGQRRIRGAIRHADQDGGEEDENSLKPRRTAPRARREAVRRVPRQRAARG